MDKFRENGRQNIEMNILAIIPARGGSKGVPHKNIKLLNNIPLIGYSIKSAMSSKYINNIIVSTDCPQIAKIAEQFNIEVPFLRPKELSNDNSTDLEYVMHTLKWLTDNNELEPDLIVILRPTTPIREVTIIDEAIETIINNKNASSLRSAHKASESPLKWFKVKNGFYTPICDNIALEDTNKPRQSVEDIYIPNGYIDIINVHLLKDNELFGNKILNYTTDLAYEIDTIDDFNYLEYKITAKEI